jgi:hypothetical protein
MSEYDIRYSNINPSDITGRLIRNPNYGGPSVGLNGWTWRAQVSKNHGAKPGFHRALAASVAKDGLRNPVLVWNLPEGLFLTFGGSRVHAALAAGIEAIPAIINDYTGSYGDGVLVTSENWESFFTDVPRTFEFTRDGADYHYHLERARRHEHDEAGLAWLGDDTPAWLTKEFPWIDNNEG